MKKLLLSFEILVSNVLLIVLFLSGSLKAQTTLTYSYTGSAQAFTVPSCVNTLTITAKGAAGGTSGYTGGEGGSVRGVISVTPGQVYNLYVGGQGSVTTGGFNGGGNGGVSPASSGGGGGGGSDVRFGGTALTNIILSAAGGGGSGGSSTYSAIAGVGGGGSSCTSPSLGVGGGGAGGCGIGSAGGCSGGSATAYGTGGGGGGVTSGAPTAGSSSGTFGGAGTLGLGGDGGSYTGQTYCNGGGGGGGGIYGGAGGMSGSGGCNGGGGGGASFAGSAFSSVTFTAGGSTSHGNIVISYIPFGTSVTPVASPTSICNGNSVNLSVSGVVSNTWLPVGTFAGSNASSFSHNPTSTTSYTVQGTNSFGCLSQTVITVTVSPGLPSLSINSSTNSICLGRTVTLTASGALTYAWTGGVTNGVSFAPSTTTSYTVTGQNGCGTTTAVTSVSVSALPVSTIASPNLVCSGSTSTLTAASSVTGYTWQPNSLVGQNVVVSPLVNTVYTVTASDGTCSGVATLTLNTKPIPTLNLVCTASTVCDGGAVTLTVSGANNYTWTPGSLNGTVVTVNPTAPVLVSVVGENSVNCTAGASQVVLVYPNPTITITASKPVVCVGGSVSLTASGAHTYTWVAGPQTSVNIQNVSTGTTYSVSGTYTDTQCFSTKTINIQVYTPQITVSGNTLVCAGSTAVLSAAGGNNNSYSWSSGSNIQSTSVSPSVTTTYTVNATATSSNVTCPGSANITVSVNPLPNITIASTKTVACRKDAGAVLTASGGATYVWNAGATTNTLLTVTSTTGTINYTVTGTDNNGCVNTQTISFLVKACVGINEWENTSYNLNVYPNPNTGSFEVKAESAVTAILVNELGQEILKLELNASNNYSANIHDLSAGVYFLKGQNGDTKINQKIVVNK